MYTPSNLMLPISDEYVLSLFMRLAEINGFSRSFTNFMGAFFIEGNQRFRYRSALSVEPIHCSMIQQLGLNQTLLLKHLEDNTLYSACAPFMSKSLQGDYVNAYTRRFPNGSILPGKYKSLAGLTEDIRFCPECVREDINDMGFWWLKKDHHLPAVHMCAKHGTPLHILRNDISKIDIFSMPETENVCTATDIDLDYARFLSGLAHLKPDICLTDMRKTIDVKELDFSVGILTFVENPERLRKSLSTSGRHEQIPISDAAIVLMYLYGSPKNIPFGENPETDNEKKAFEGALKMRGYSLISDYHRCRPMIIRHEKCGYGHCTTAWNFLHGWECPQCDLSRTDTQIITSMIETTGGGEYHLLNGNVTSLSKPVEVLHEKCGQVKSVPLQMFLKQRFKCKCEQKVSEEDFLERMSNVNPDIDFLSPYAGYTNSIQCKCKTCGREWIALPSKLLIGTGCPDYYKHDDYISPLKFTTDDFRNRLANVRPDLELIGDYAGNLEHVELRCRICGSEFTAIPDRIRKKKCPNKNSHYNSIKGKGE